MSAANKAVPKSWTRLAEIYNDVENYPLLSDVAGALGTTPNAVNKMACRIRMARGKGAHIPFLITRNSPMSESAEKFHPEWDADDCIAELLRIVRANPDRYISRNDFRVESQISEATWTRYFGTFQEFKRQAGVMPSRQVHQLEKHVAKHASVDHYRRIGQERSQLGDRYLRRDSSRYKTIVFGSDLHDKEVDPFFLHVFVDACRRARPDVVSFVGDVFDLPEFGKYGVDPREWDVVGRIQAAHNIFHLVREACPSAQIDLIEGNHEARLLKHLADASPAMRAVLSDLHGMSIAKLLGLDQFQMNYVAQGDLAAYTRRDGQHELEKNYRIYFDAVLAHHFPHARNMGMPGVNGHHHRHQVWPMFNPMFGAYEWHQMGCGHQRQASYCEGEKWHMGFAICHVDTLTRSTVFEYVPVTDHAIVGGQWYHRDEIVRAARK